MKFFYGFLFLLLSLNLRATHFIGGEMYYDYLGGNNYQFNLVFYRDCSSSGAGFDAAVHFSVYDQSGSLLQNVTDSFPGSSQVFLVPFINAYDIPCAVTSADTCVEYTIYSAIINLPPIVGGYNVSYQRCCLAADAINVANSGDNGFTLTSHIPGSDTGDNINSSPRFPNHSPFAICNNTIIPFDHSAIDPDGDSLSYFISAAISGGSSVSPNPATALPPPYDPLVWIPGYSEVFAFGMTSTLEVDSSSGMLTLLPKLAGPYIFAIRVQEFRDGGVVSETVRNLMVQVIAPPNTSNMDEKETDQIGLFPNPSSGQFEIVTPREVSEIRVYNIIGEKIMELYQTSSVDMRHLETGIYFISITSNNQTIVEKFQKL